MVSPAQHWPQYWHANIGAYTSVNNDAFLLSPATTARTPAARHLEGPAWFRMSASMIEIRSTDFTGWSAHLPSPDNYDLLIYSGPLRDKLFTSSPRRTSPFRQLHDFDGKAADAGFSTASATLLSCQSQPGHQGAGLINCLNAHLTAQCQFSSFSALSRRSQMNLIPQLDRCYTAILYWHVSGLGLPPADYRRHRIRRAPCSATHYFTFSPTTPRAL